jgi:signal transduction histidine kinase
MNRKNKKQQFLIDYSSPLLAILTIFTLIVIIYLFQQKLNDTVNTIMEIGQVNIQAFNYDLDEGIQMDTEVIANLLAKFEEISLGQAGEEFQITINMLYYFIDEYSVENDPEKNIILINFCKMELLNLVKLYRQKNEIQITAFKILLFFLTGGVIIQFIIIITSLVNKNSALNQLELSQFSIQELQKTRENEREKIASFLHDSILQDLGSLLLLPEIYEYESVRKRLDDIVTTLRNLTYSTAPLQLYNIGLIDSLEELVLSFKQETDILVNFQIIGFNDTALEDDVMLVFFRIVQESLHNIKKHAGAESVDVKLVVAYPYIFLTISDNGCGMDLDKLTNVDGNDKHFGLLLMEQQVNSINGEFSIHSKINEGTTIKMKYIIKTEGLNG